MLRSIILSEKKLLLLLAAALVFLASSGWEATYYVDATNGKDTNTGLSQTTAWKTIAKVNASRFNPGDHILFRRGDVWREQLNVPSSGSSGKLITFGAYGSGNDPIIKGSNLYTVWNLESGNVWKSWVQTAPNTVFMNGTKGTQRANMGALAAEYDWYNDPENKFLYIYTATNPDSRYTFPGVEACARVRTIAINSKNYITIDGLHLTNGNSTNGGSLQATGTGLTIQNCTIDYNAGHGILGWAAGATTISGNTITRNEGHGVAPMEGCQSWTVTGNTFSGNGQTDVYSWYKEAAEYAVSDLIIQHNDSSNCGGYAYSIANANNVLIQNNTVNGVGKQAIHANAIGILTSSGTLIIRYNSITDVDNCKNVDVSDSAAIIADTDSDGTEIYYNKMWDIAGSGVIIWQAANVKVYNNTIINTGNNKSLNALSRTAIRASGTGSGSPTIMNNIVSDGYTNIYIGAEAISGATVNYNIYDDNSATKFHWNTTDYNFADWKTNSSQDANSSVADPLFVNATGGNFQLLQTSPCIDAGADVSLTTDYAGNAVPHKTTPDIGAYEWQGSFNSSSSI